MKTVERLKTIALLLLVTVIIFASFFGVYKKEDFRAVNIIKGYKLGMQFTNSVKFTGTVSQEEKQIIKDAEGNVVKDDGETDYTEANGYTVTTEKVNSDDVLNEANYKLTKKILKNRLKGMKVGDYKLALNKETGEITIKLPENDDVHEIEEHLLEKGEFKIIDKETEEVLLDKSKMKFVKVVYAPSKEDQKTTVIYLQIDFDKEGAKKLEEISQIYVEEEHVEEHVETEEHTHNAKYVNIVLDGETLSSTYFGEKMSTGTLYVSLTQASDAETLTEYIKEISNIATVINSGELPIKYNFDENTEETTINQNKLFLGIAIPGAILLVACVILVIKFKAKGFIATFMQIGYIAFLLLAVRYFDVTMTIQGMVGIGISAVLNYALNFVMLNELKNKGKIEWNKIGKFALWTIPVYVLAVILSFNSLTILSSLGMTLVWGSICLYLYNLTLTKTMLDMLSK